MTESTIGRLVTGNRLTDGVPVYYAGADRWVRNIDEAALVAAAEAEALLKAALAPPPPHPVVAPYLIEAVRDAAGVSPLSLRERIRAFGPTA